VIQLSPISESKFQRAEEDQDLGQLSQEIRSVKRTNDGLRDQNNRLMTINEKLIFETEALRGEIIKLRMVMGGQQGQNASDTYITEIRTLTEKLSILQRSEGDRMRENQNLGQENMVLKRRIEELELNLKRVIEQNRLMTGELDSNNLRKNTDSAAYTSIRSENVELKVIIENIKNNSAFHEKQAKENLRQLEDLSNKYNGLVRENQRLVDENAILSRRSVGPSNEDQLRAKIIQLEQGALSANNIIADLKARLSRSQVDMENKDKELVILREEIRAIQNSGRGESARLTLDYQREKQELINLNQMLSSKLRDLNEDNNRLTLTLKDRDARLEAALSEARMPRLEGGKPSREGLAYLLEELRKYFDLGRQDRKITKEFGEENITSIGRVSNSASQIGLPLEHPLRDNLNKTIVISNNFNIGEYAKRAQLHQKISDQESSILLLIETLSKEVPELKMAKKERSRSPSKRQSNFKYQNLETDNSDLIRKILIDETGHPNNDKLQVVKNRQDITYDCSFIEFVPDESSVTGARRVVKIIRIPCNVIDELKDIHIIRTGADNSASLGASLTRSMIQHLSEPQSGNVIREQYHQERRMVEHLKLTDDDHVEHVLGQSKISGGGQTMQVSKLVADLIAPAANRKDNLSAVIMERRFTTDLGSDFKFINSIICQGIIRKSDLRMAQENSCLVKIEDFDHHTIKTGQEVFFFKQDYNNWKTLTRRELLLNELLSTLNTQPIQDPSKIAVYRQLESPTEVLIEKIILDQSRINSNFAPIPGQVVEAYTLKKSDLAEICSTPWEKSPQDRTFSFVSKSSEKGKVITRNFQAKISLQGRIPRIELTKVNESEEQEKIAGMVRPTEVDSNLQKFIVYLKSDNISASNVHIKEKEELTGVVIDAFSTQQRNDRQKTESDCDPLRIIRRVVFDSEAEAFRRPPVSAEQFNGQKSIKESLTFDRTGQVQKLPQSSEDILSMYGREGLALSSDADRHLRFEKSVSRFSPQAAEAIKQTMARYSDFQSTINAELSELLYLLQSEDQFCSFKNVFMRCYIKGDNKIFDKIYVPEDNIDEIEDSSKPIEGYVTERIVLTDYMKPQNTDWIIQKEYPFTGENHKRTERVIMDKVKWKDLSNVYNFKPNNPKNKAIFDFSQQMETYEDEQGEQQLALEKCAILPEELCLINEMMRAHPQQAESYHLLLQTVDSAGPRLLRLEKFTLPKLGINFLLLVAKLQFNLESRLAVEEVHGPDVSVVTIAERPRNKAPVVLHVATVSHLGQQDLGLPDLPMSKTSLTAWDEFNRIAKRKDKEMMEKGDILIREHSDPVTNDLIIERLTVDNSVRLKKDIPEDLQPFSVEIQNRIFEKVIFPRSNSAVRKGVDFIFVCQGVQNLLSLLSEPTSGPVIMTLVDSEDKLVLEKSLVSKFSQKDFIQVVQRLTVRLEKTLHPTSERVILPTDLKIIKETLIKNQWHICTIKLSETSGIPIANSKLKKTFEDLVICQGETKQGVLTQLFTTLPPIHLKAFLRYLSETKAFDSKSYLRVMQDQTGGNRLTFEKLAIDSKPLPVSLGDSIIEKITVIPEQSLSTLIIRQLTDDQLLVEETIKITPSSQVPEEEQALIPHSFLKEEQIRQRAVITKRPDQIKLINLSQENKPIFSKRADNELLLALQAFYGYPAPEVDAILRSRPQSRVVIWKKNEVDRTIYRRILFSNPQGNQGLWQTEILDTVIVQTPTSLPTQLTTSSVQMVPGSQQQSANLQQKNLIVKESYDFSRGSRLVRKYTEVPNMSTSNNIPVLQITNEDNVRDLPKTLREEVQVFGNLVTQVFLNPQSLNNGVILINEEVTKGVLHLQEFCIEGEYNERGDITHYLHMNKDLLTNSEQSILGIQTVSVPTTTSGVFYMSVNRDLKLITLEITRSGYNYSVKPTDQITIEDSGLLKMKPLSQINFDEVASMMLRNVSQRYQMNSKLCIVDNTELTTHFKILSLLPEHRLESSNSNPLAQKPKNMAIQVDSITQLDSVFKRPDSPLVVQVTQTTSKDPNTVIVEKLEVKDVGQIQVQKLSSMETILRDQLKVDPIDRMVLNRVAKLMTYNSDIIEPNTCVLIRKTREKLNLVYELVLYSSQDFSAGFRIVEILLVKPGPVMSGGSPSMVSASKTQTSLFTSYLDDDNMNASITKITTQKEGNFLCESVHVQGGSVQRKVVAPKYSLFELTGNLSTQRYLPVAATSLLSEGKFSSEQPQLAISVTKDPAVQRLIDLLSEVKTSDSTHSVLFVDNLQQNPQLQVKKISMIRDEPDISHVTVSGDRDLGSVTFQREVWVEAEKTRVREQLSIRDGKTVVERVSKEIGTVPNSEDAKLRPFEPEFVIKYLTKQLPILKQNEVFLLRTDNTIKFTFEVVRNLDKTRQIILERIEVFKKPDMDGRYRAIIHEFISTCQTEETIDIEVSKLALRQASSPEILSRSSRVIQNKPDNLYFSQGSAEDKGVLSNYNFEPAFNSMIPRELNHPILLHHYSERGRPILEKVVIGHDRVPRSVDKFSLVSPGDTGISSERLSDLDKLIGPSLGVRGQPISPQDPKNFLPEDRIRSINTENLPHSVYFLRQVVKEGQPIGQIIKMVPILASQQQVPLELLGVRTLRPEEVQGDIEFFLNFIKKAPQFLTNTKEGRYIVVKEWPVGQGRPPGALVNEVVGYSSRVSKVFRHQLSELGPQIIRQVQPAIDQQEVLMRIESLNRMLLDKQTEIQRLEITIKSLAERPVPAPQPQMSSEILVRENQALSKRLQDSLDELNRSKSEMNDLYTKYQKILGDLNGLMRYQTDYNSLKQEHERVLREGQSRPNPGLQDEIARCYKEIERLNAEKQALERRITEIRETTTITQVVHQSPDKLVIDSLRMELENLRQELDRAKRELDRLRGEKLALEKRITETEVTTQTVRTDILVKENATIDSLHKEIDRCQKEIKRLEALLKNSQQNDGLSTEVERLETRMKDQNADHRRELELKSSEIASLTREIARLTSTGLDQSVTSSTVTELQARITSLEREVSNLRSQLVLKEEKIRDFQLRMSSLTEINTEVTTVHAGQGRTVSIDERILLDLKKKNDYLIKELTKLQTDVRSRSHSPHKSRAAPDDDIREVARDTYAKPSIRIVPPLAELNGRTRVITRKEYFNRMSPGKFDPERMSIDADRDSELFRRYMMLREEYSSLYLDWTELTNENSHLQSHIIELQAAAFIPKSPTSQRPVIEVKKDDRPLSFRDQLRQDEADRRSRSQSTSRAIDVRRREEYELRCRVEELERELRRKDAQVDLLKIDREPP
jgi:hypothetical protein